MTRKLTRILVASVLGTALALAPAAFGHGGGGGGHGGGGGGGGMGVGGGMGGMGGRGAVGGLGGRGVVGGRSVGGAADPRVGGFGRPAVVGQRFGATAWTRAPRYVLHNRVLRHRRFAFFGAPYYSYYDSCWQTVWTGFGTQWVNVCGDYYGNGYY